MRSLSISDKIRFVLFETFFCTDNFDCFGLEHSIVSRSSLDCELEYAESSNTGKVYVWVIRLVLFEYDGAYLMTSRFFVLFDLELTILDVAESFTSFC